MCQRPLRDASESISPQLVAQQYDMIVTGFFIDSKRAPNFCRYTEGVGEIRCGTTDSESLGIAAAGDGHLPTRKGRKRCDGAETCAAQFVEAGGQSILFADLGHFPATPLKAIRGDSGSAYANGLSSAPFTTVNMAVFAADAECEGEDGDDGEGGGAAQSARGVAQVARECIPP